MTRYLYNLIFYLALPFIALKLKRRSRRNPDYALRWKERLGYYPKVAQGQKAILWFHAVSVGEVHAAVPLVREFMHSHPGSRVVLTTMTPTGSSRVREIFGKEVEHVYMPYDFPGGIKRFLRHFKPVALVIMETELWPNLLYYCQRQGIPVMLANARLSGRSLDRYLRFPKFAASMVSRLTMVAAQSENDASAFEQLGLEPGKVKVTGTMKFDVTVPLEQLEQARQFRNGLGQRPVVTAGSTREGEEIKVLKAFRAVLQEYPDTLLVLVPRHQDRISEVVSLLVAENFSFSRKSQAADTLQGVQVLLGDTMGEMAFYYALANVAFVGGSLVDTGCQNIIEPAALGLPVITGPSLYNFSKVSTLLLQGGGMYRVDDGEGFAARVVELLASPESRLQMGANARKVVENNQGATRQMLTMIEHLLEPE